MTSCRDADDTKVDLYKRDPLLKQTNMCPLPNSTAVCEGSEGCTRGHPRNSLLIIMTRWCDAVVDSGIQGPIGEAWKDLFAMLVHRRSATPSAFTVIKHGEILYRKCKIQTIACDARPPRADKERTKSTDCELMYMSIEPGDPNITIQPKGK